MATNHGAGGSNPSLPDNTFFTLKESSMQTIRGTRDILPNEIRDWQQIYIKALNVFDTYNYHEIRTPIIENADVFLKSVGESTDIVSKEMYRFIDQGQRDIVLRPEGTACVARAIASNKLYKISPIQKLWYTGPMFRYERPQYGRQRQFHQLGTEYIGSNSPLADVEVINIAHTILQRLGCTKYVIEINSLGTSEERHRYKSDFRDFLENYKEDLDSDSQKRLYTNPLRILDSKNAQTQEIVKKAPCLSMYLNTGSQAHFDSVREHLEASNIQHKINTRLIRGLDYYNHTAFEIISEELGRQNTICGGGRYSHLVKQFGGPDLTGVGWAIGIERLLSIIKKDEFKALTRFEIIAEGPAAEKKSWGLAQELEKHNISFNLNLGDQSLRKKIKKAIQNNALGCLIIGNNEIKGSAITVKWPGKHLQETICYDDTIKYLKGKLKEYNY